ncbi:MAG: hypothetical protein K0R62_7215, partial [Nonomuraea muscovyensis]|nr:hypothetical protein [Nonomuraea muscovyensis]
MRGAGAVQGAGPDAPKIAVSRAGYAPDLPLDPRWGPEDLVA